MAPLGAAAVLVLTLAGFGALDFHNSTMLRSDLQDALDASTLAVARTTLTKKEDIQAYGAELLKKSLHKSAKVAVLESSEFKEVDGVMTGVATLSFKPVISGLIGNRVIQIGAKSLVARAGENLEIALVLDNTYSMLGTRLSTLKTSATNFVNILEHAASLSRDPNALKISLVPFATTVNVGSGYKNAEWMDTQALSPIHKEIFNGASANRFDLYGKVGTSWAGCVESRPAPFDVQDTAPTAADPRTLVVPYFAPDESDVWGGWSTADLYYVNNYVPDGVTGDWFVRQTAVAKYNQKAADGAIGNGYHRGPNYECTLKPLLRLTTSEDKVREAIDALTVSGDTNIPMGLVWGWHTLSPNAPFADGSAYGRAKTKKIVVLMTDGQNSIWNNGLYNESLYSGLGYIKQGRIGITTGTATERRDALDGRLSLLCTNMKAKHILIYTIRLEVDDNAVDVLRNCASEPGMFYDVKQASELNAAFRAIAADIQNLRLAK